MKTCFILGLAALTLVAATPSFAARGTARSAVITCSNAKLDHGFILTAAGRGDVFSIQKQSIVGPQPMGTAACRPVPNRAMFTPGDTMRLAQICETQAVQGQQLRIEISEGGFFFHQTADLVQIAGGQRRVLADDMLCHQNPTE